MTADHWRKGALLAIPLLLLLWWAWSDSATDPVQTRPEPDFDPSTQAHLADSGSSGHMETSASTIPEGCAGCPDAGLEAMKRHGNDPLDQGQLDKDCRELLREAAAAGVPDPDTSQLGGCGGNTPLFMAETAAQVQTLLDAGADVNARDQYGNTPLMRQAIMATWKRGSDEGLFIIKKLLEAGADVHLESKWGENALETLWKLDGTGHLHLSWTKHVEAGAKAQGVSVPEYLEAHPVQKMIAEEWPKRFLLVAKIEEALLEALTKER